MGRTLLIADADDFARERISKIASDTGYRVLKARTPLETTAALDGCPITGIVIAEDLLRQCDLGRLLVRAPVLVLSLHRRATMAQDISFIPTSASDLELKTALAAVAGDPRYLGPRDVIQASFATTTQPRDRSGAA